MANARVSPAHADLALGIRGVATVTDNSEKSSIQTAAPRSLSERIKSYLSKEAITAPDDFNRCVCSAAAVCARNGSPFGSKYHATG